jgi:hypothetical protein
MTFGCVIQFGGSKCRYPRTSQRPWIVYHALDLIFGVAFSATKILFDLSAHVPDGPVIGSRVRSDHLLRGLHNYLQTGCPFTSAGVLPGGQVGLVGGGTGFAETGAGGCGGGGGDEGLIVAGTGPGECGGGAGLSIAGDGPGGCGGGGGAGLSIAGDGPGGCDGGGGAGLSIAGDGPGGCDGGGGGFTNAVDGGGGAEGPPGVPA